MSLRLSRRQQEVLGMLLDLYYEGGEPVHYTTLAKHLGVTPVSAYEMLRLLEENRMVVAEYQRPETPCGPGRPTVVFRPTNAAIQRLRTFTGTDITNQEEWHQVKTRIQHQIQNYQGENLEELLGEILDYVPEGSFTLPSLASIVTAILINLHLLGEDDELSSVRKNLLKNGDLSDPTSVSTLIGLGISLAISRRLYYRLGSLLLSHTSQIVTAIVALNPDKLNRLADLIHEVTRVL